MISISHEEMVAQLASQLHDDWRRPRQLADGAYEPRIKPTTDAAWIAAHGGKDTIDIANTSYVDLPADWQAENKAAAEHALDVCEEAPDTAAAKLHAAWMERNPKAAHNEAQHVPFNELPEEEKEKDRKIIKAAGAVKAAAWVAENYR